VRPDVTPRVSFERIGNGAIMIDDIVTQLARRHWGTRVDAAAIWASHLGRGGLVWLTADAALRSRRSRLPLPSSAVVRATGLSYVGSLLLARLLGRSRPCHGGQPALIDCPQGPGLPSDQTAAAFAGAYALSRRYPSAAGAFYCLATAIAAARVYCGVHHLTDTIAGAAIGTAIAAVGE
jgi:membrane-associated phospholipid phosphatase